MKLILTIPAKINLSLDITGKRPDGYHTLRSVFQTVGIYDRLTLETTDPAAPLTLTCDDPAVPCDERNLVWKAAVRLLGEAPAGVAMHLEKHIPSQAGMGGGSADCAAALLGLRELLQLDLSDEALHAHAAALGADVPFFLRGGTVLCEGIGEIMTPLPALPERVLVIAKGSEGISTPQAYKRLDGLETPPPLATGNVIKALQKAPDKVFTICGNWFDAVADLPEIALIRRVMWEHGMRPILSGSGAAVFGGCKTEAQAEKCAAALREAGLPFVQVCTTTSHGITMTQE